MSTAVDTLAAQFNGAKQYREVGIVVQRSIVVLSLLLIPIGVIWCYVREIFEAVGVAPDISEVMATYIKVYAWALPVLPFFQTYRRYLIALGITRPGMYMSITTDIVLVLSGYILVEYYNFGVEGVAWASVISTTCSRIILLAITWNHPQVQRTLQPPHRDALAGIPEFISLGVPGCVMICAEWWAYELLLVFASSLGSEAVTAQSLIFQLSNMTYMIPSCVSSAAGSLVGNVLGSGDASLAIDVASLCLMLIFAMEFVIAPCMAFFGKYFVSLYASDPTVVRICDAAIPILAVVAVTDGIQGVCSGILRGCGKQNIGAIVNVFCYYGVGKLSVLCLG